MKKILLLIVLFLSFTISAQIKFEKAYFIDNNDNRIECFIKNADWKNNPDFFNYKLFEESEIKTASVKEVKAFEIYNQNKFVRGNVDFDKSSININNLSETSEPEFVQRQLFLKQIVNGSVNLYKYDEGNGIKFFYQKADNEFEQLIYKPYQLELFQIGYNDTYKQQLIKLLVCNSISKNQIENTIYKEKNMIDLFTKFNQCIDPDYENVAVAKKKGELNLSVRPRANLSSLDLSNSTTRDLFEFGDKTSFGVGLELEYIIPFNKNKWAFIIEPAYRTYKGETVIEPFYMAGNKLFAFADYQSIEVPMGIRHYMYLDSKSRIFVNAQYVFDLNLGSSLEIRRSDGFVSTDLEVDSFANFALGAGYSYNSKYGVELRYFTTRNIVRGYPSFGTSYKNVSLILSYTVF